MPTRDPKIQAVIDASIERARADALARQENAVLGADLIPVTRTQSVELRLKTPQDFDQPGIGMVRLLRVSATVTYSLDPTDEEEFDVRPDVDVMGLMHPLTAKGEPSRKDGPYWRHLPRSLAPTLIGLAAVAPTHTKETR